MLWVIWDTHIIVCNNHNYPVCVCTAGLCIWLRRFAYVCLYNVAKKRAVWGLTTWKSPVSVIYCLLIKYKCQKGAHYARQFLQGNKFWSILLTERKKSSGKFKSHFIYMQCSYAVPANAERQHATAVQTYNIATGTAVLTVLRAHRVCVLWNSS